MNINKKIAPCPFCWGEAKLITAFSYGNKRNYYFVTCKNCGAETSRTFRSPNFAIEAWNKRVNDGKLFGEWIKLCDEVIKCSCCGHYQYIVTAYCSCCGANMKGN